MMVKREKQKDKQDKPGERWKDKKREEKKEGRVW